MSKTYRHLDPPPTRPIVPPAPPVVRLLALCRDCGIDFRTTATHAERCPACHRAARDAYRRTDRRITHA